MKYQFLPFLFIITTLITGCAVAPINSDAKTSSPAPQSSIFKKGDSGYAAFRIPALFVSKSGKIFAFSEARKKSEKDFGQIDSVLRMSEDNGKTWGPLQVIASNGKDSYTNPMAVQDSHTGRITFLCSYSPGDINEWQMISREAPPLRKIFVKHSQDDGKTWSDIIDISPDIKPADTSWIVVGPSGGIQIEGGKFNGRLVVPITAAGFGSPAPYYVWAIFSDDGGITWKRGEKVPTQKTLDKIFSGKTPPENLKGSTFFKDTLGYNVGDAWKNAKKIPTPIYVNESQIAQVDNETIIVNSRVQQDAKAQIYRRRHVAASHDGGATWYSTGFDNELVETMCCASTKSVKIGGDTNNRVLIFSAPNPEIKDENEKICYRREKVTMRFSDAKLYRQWLDAGCPQKFGELLWKTSIIVDEGYSAYSDISILPDGNIGVLYERGANKRPYDEISFKAFPFTKF